MDSGLFIFAALSILAMTFGYLGFLYTSFREERLRPVIAASLLFLPVFSPLIFLLVQNRPVIPAIAAGTLLVLGFLLILPFGKLKELEISGEQKRLDERDALFHRFYALKPETPEYEEYYTRHPSKRQFDDDVRNLPGFEEEGSHSFHPLVSLYQKSLSDQIELFAAGLDSDPSPAGVEADPLEMTGRLKGFARYLGADLVGSTRLKQQHVYSHSARDPRNWGKPVELDHSHALVIAVEMKYEMVRHAPWSEVITESSFDYFRTAGIASTIARYIQLLGHEARAHFDQNYQVLCVPIAVDAGLGELGRMGLLVTPRFGPRVRLSIVTTNLPLLQDNPINFGVGNFCEICRKCAANCPSSSISTGSRTVSRGVEKWKSQMESCYRFWRRQGSDCAVCLKVCPYSHPTTPFHNLVRKAVSRNPMSRRLALWGDDLFYGRRISTEYAQEEWHRRDD